MTDPERDLGPEVRQVVLEPSGPAFRRLVAVMAKLRSPTGCPWDREQTHATLAPHLLEETYETLEAIDANDGEALREELGDVVLQVVFHAQLAFEEDGFTIADVLNDLRAKLIRRHPHVFGDAEVEGADEVLANWERIKRSEKGTGVMDGIPKALPALARAAKVFRRGQQVGFRTHEGVQETLDKLTEEIGELRRELEAGSPSLERVEAEIGDALFILSALAHRFDIDPEAALRRMLQRTESRFRAIEDFAGSENRTLESLSPDEWARYWDQAKQENP